MKWKFLIPIAFAIFVPVRILLMGHKYHGNPIFADYNFVYWALIVISIIASRIIYYKE